MKTVLLLISFFVLVPLSFAEKLTIIDTRGLTRAVKEVQEKADVVVTVGDGGGVSVHLENIDGLGAEKVGAVSGAIGKYRFTEVSPGTWRISVVGTGAEIQKVEIR